MLPAARRLTLIWLVAVLAALGVAAPAPASADTPPTAAGGTSRLKPNATVDVYKDLRYSTVAAGSAGLADVYIPRNGQAANPSVFVWHGGGWSTGDKADVATWAREMAERGWTVIAANYRLTNVAPWPAQVIDAKAVIRATVSVASAFHVWTGKLAVAGVSAGAQMAQIVSATNGYAPWDQGANLNYSSNVAAAVAESGEADLNAIMDDPCCSAIVGTPQGAFLDAFLGGPARDRADVARDASPLTWVTPGDPPILLWSGDADPLIPIGQPGAMFDAQRADGIRSALIIEPGMGHVDTSWWTDAHFNLISGWLDQRIR